jgi:hypothetical protein
VAAAGEKLAVGVAYLHVPIGPAGHPRVTAHAAADAGHLLRGLGTVGRVVGDRVDEPGAVTDAGDVRAF